MSETQVIEIPVGEFDLELLPPAARQPGTGAFRNAVSAFIESEFRGFAGRVQIVIDPERIRVVWHSKPEAPDPLQEAVARLQRGDYGKGVQLLRLILPSRPRDAAIHFNLGMALSDLGKLDEAEDHLREAIDIDPEIVHAKVALGVALMRKKKFQEASEVLEEAVEQDPNDPYALMNLGGCLEALKRDLPRAEACLRKATEILPEAQQMWFGLARVLESQGKLEEADKVCIKAIEIDPHTKFAEAAKQMRSRFAVRSFREKTHGAVRTDALLHCVAALSKFKDMTPEDVQKVGFEIATLGMRGIDTGDPRPKYKLRSLPGEFSGMQLLCYEFVAFKQIDPSLDIGFDLSKEYDAALKLNEPGK